MREYNFEYADQPLIIKLMLIACTVLVLLLCSIIITKDIIGDIAGVIIAFAVPVLIIVLNRKKFKIYGSATISDSFVDFRLKNLNERIQFSNVKSYMVQIFRGVKLKIRLNDGRKIELMANENFCNSEMFGLFCNDLEKTLSEFRSENKTEVIREKSVFEKKGMFYFLIIFSAILAAAMLYVSLMDQKMPVAFFTSAGAIAVLWGAYFQTKKRNK